MPKQSPKTEFAFDSERGVVVEKITTQEEVGHDVMDARIKLEQALQDRDAINARIAKLEAILAVAQVAKKNA